MTSHRFSLTICLLGCLALGSMAGASATPTPASADRSPIEIDGVQAAPRLAQAQGSQLPAPAPSAPTGGAPATTTPPPASSDEPIGNVATLTGVATVVRNKNSIALKIRDDIYLNDIVETAASSSLGITFNDATTFHLTANARMTIDNYVYEDGGKQNAAIFDIANGTIAFVAAAVARTGDMKIGTPTATLGIRGTTGLVEVPQGAGAAGAGANDVNIKLYPDADGRVGHIDVNDRAGVRLGTLTQGASGFTIRRGPGGTRFAAVPLTISPQQAARDQGFVRQVHATQSTGRQIVSQQRAIRRANPALRNRGNRPGQQRPNGLPGQNRPGQRSMPNRQGQQLQRPGAPQQRGEQQRPGRNTPAIQPRQGDLQRDGAPRLQRQREQRPAFQRRPEQRPAFQRRPAPQKRSRKR